MLKPNKHSHPDQTVLAAATVILRELKRSRAASYDDLRVLLAKRVRGADYLFLPALSLLFLLDLVEYRAKIDAFEYRGAN